MATQFSKYLFFWIILVLCIDWAEWLTENFFEGRFVNLVRPLLPSLLLIFYLKLFYLSINIFYLSINFVSPLKRYSE